MFNLGIIQGFKQFLKEKSEADSSFNCHINSVSIFSQYQDQFKEYIHETFGSKYDSIFGEGFKVSDLKNIRYTNGKFENSNRNSDNSDSELFAEILNELSQNEGFLDTIDSNYNGKITNREYSSYIDSITEGDETLDGDKLLNFMSDSMSEAQTINDFFSDKNNIEMFDLDGDNVLSDEEKANTKEFLSALSGDGDNLSSEDIKIFTQMLDNNGDGNISNDERSVLKQCMEILGNSKNSKGNPLKVLKDYIDKLYENPNYNKDNLIDFIKSLDGDSDNLTVDDLLKLAEYAAEGIMPNEILEAADAQSASSSPAGSGANAPFSPAVKEKNIDNMSIEELEEELSNAQSTADTALNELEETLKEENAELAEKLSTAKENITETQNQITEKNTLLTEKQTSLTEAQNSVSQLGSEISSLEGQLSSCENESEKSALRQQIEQLKDQKQELETNTIPKLNEEIQQINEELTTLNSTLEEYNAEFAEIQNEISTLAQTNEAIAAKQEEYQQATEYVNNIQSKLALRKADEEKAKNVDMPEIDERSKDYSQNEEYDFTNLPLTYTLDGQTYNCVGFASYNINGVEFKPDSWEEAQRYLANGGIANIGQSGDMQCHNYSNVAADLSIGTVNSELLEAMYQETNDPNYGDTDTAGKMGTQKEYNGRDFAQCKAKDRDAERAIIENELQNGRPVLVSVPSASGGTHWVTAIGISETGDILIWDSYDGGIEKLGKSSNDSDENLGRNMATANGIMVFCNGYRYDYNTARYIDYWQMINDPNYDPLVEGVK